MSRRAGSHARQSGPRRARRQRRRLPGTGRLAAGVLFAAFGGAILVALAGPWLRVEHWSAHGQRYTSEDAIDAILESVRGASMLAVDPDALRAELEGLPAVAQATVDTSLSTGLAIRLEEKEPAFVWRTATSRLVGAADGVLFAEDERDAGDVVTAELPLITDQRTANEGLAVGDKVPADELRIALQVLELDPAQAGSAGQRFAVRFADEYGLLIVCRNPVWEAALGAYGLDPGETPASADARLAQQIAAIRTLFSTTPELNVTWVDVRNPGKVYWAP